MGVEIMNIEEINMLYSEDFSSISIKQLPISIATQFEKIKELENSVEKSMILAQDANKKAQDANTKVGLFNQINSIKYLQEVAKGLAEAQVSSTEAQGLLLNYQTKLSEITKGLFALGVSNITANRIVVRNIQMQLQGASEAELSQMARQELLSVVKQLKAQEDIMNKHAKLSKVVQKQDQVLKHQQLRDKEHDKILIEQMQKDEEHDRILEHRGAKDEEHDRLFDEMKEKNGVLEVDISALRKDILKCIKSLECLQTEKYILEDKVIQLEGKVLELKKDKNSLNINIFKGFSIIAFLISMIVLILNW